MVENAHCVEPFPYQVLGVIKHDQEDVPLLHREGPEETSRDPAIAEDLEQRSREDQVETVRRQSSLGRVGDGKAAELEEMVEARLFRRDLRDRFGFLVLRLPGLAERQGRVHAHPKRIEVEAGPQVGTGASHKRDRGAVDDVAHGDAPLAFAQRRLHDGRRQRLQLLDQYVHRGSISDHTRRTACGLLGLDVHARGQRRGQVEARVAIIALAVAQHRAAVPQLHLGPRHQTLKPDTFPALVQVAAKANRSDDRGLGLHLDGFWRWRTRFQADALSGGDLSAGGE